MRVENVKGAVWTVDEIEFYKRRPQRLQERIASGNSTGSGLDDEYGSSYWSNDDLELTNPKKHVNRGRPKRSSLNINRSVSMTGGVGSTVEPLNGRSALLSNTGHTTSAPNSATIGGYGCDSLNASLQALSESGIPALPFLRNLAGGQLSGSPSPRGSTTADSPSRREYSDEDIADEEYGDEEEEDRYPEDDHMDEGLDLTLRPSANSRRESGSDSEHSTRRSHIDNNYNTNNSYNNNSINRDMDSVNDNNSNNSNNNNNYSPNNLNNDFAVKNSLNENPVTTTTRPMDTTSGEKFAERTVDNNEETTVDSLSADDKDDLSVKC